MLLYCVLKSHFGVSDLNGLENKYTEGEIILDQVTYKDFM